ncbi:MAG TPA: CPBP family intramembrane glutamic endopeptidase [Gaiellaceae bacterium]|nr:CPBP family intramembrane glutamic endopeptidase [Gaiellaceae bacterium]
MRARAWLGVTASFAAVNFYAVAHAPERGGDTVYSYDIFVSAVIVYGLLLAFVYAVTSGLPRRELLALRAPDSWGGALGMWFGGLLAIFAGAYFLLWLAGAGDEQNLAPDGWDGSRAGAYAASFLAIVLIGPFVEELLYRGVGVGLLQAYGRPAAIGVTALMFGLGHGLLLSLGAFIWFGLVTAAIRLRSDSLYPSLAVHVTFNAVGMIAPLLF